MAATTRPARPRRRPTLRGIRRITIPTATAVLVAGALGVTAHAAGAPPTTPTAAVAYTGTPAGAVAGAAAHRDKVRVLHLLPEGDGFVSSAWRRMHTGKEAHVTVGTRHRNRRTAYLRFRVPHGGTVTRAVLTMHRFGAWAPQPLSARLATSSSWSEWSLTAHKAPRIGRWLSTSSVHRAQRTVSFTLTSAFQYRRTATVALIAPVRRGIVQLASKQAPRARPVLTVVIRWHLRVPQGGPSPTPTPTPTSSAPTSPSPTTSAPTSPSPTSTAPTSPTSTTPHPTSSAPTSPSPSPTGSSSSGGSGCTVSAILVPSCGRWWGVAPDQFDWSVPLDQATAHFEAVAGRHMDIVHVYHVNGQLFPTPAEMQVANEPGDNHILLINWKPATDMSWAAVAAGGADTRIATEANYLKSHFTAPFFLAIYHEPEDNVGSGPGMSATDYAAMYRHVVLQLRADGVHNAITVMDYMGFNKWAGKSWFTQLWPGDDVVDWIGFDPYGTGSASDHWTAHDLNVLINRQDSNVNGYYNWATTTHPGKPIMLCEWGVSYDPGSPTGQAAFFNSMDSEIGAYPDLKALVYYDVPNRTGGIPWTTVEQNQQAEAAFRSVSNSTPFQAPPWQY